MACLHLATVACAMLAGAGCFRDTLRERLVESSTLHSIEADGDLHVCVVVASIYNRGSKGWGDGPTFFVERDSFTYRVSSDGSESECIAEGCSRPVPPGPDADGRFPLPDGGELRIRLPEWVPYEIARFDESGVELWRHAPPSFVQHLLVDGSDLLLAGKADITKLSFSTGARIWTHRIEL